MSACPNSRQKSIRPDQGRSRESSAIGAGTSTGDSWIRECAMRTFREATLVQLSREALSFI
jgi:hypothetical protein